MTVKLWTICKCKVDPIFHEFAWLFLVSYCSCGQPKRIESIRILNSKFLRHAWAANPCNIFNDQKKNIYINGKNFKSSNFVCDLASRFSCRLDFSKCRNLYLIHQSLLRENNRFFKRHMHSNDAAFH